jgi:hypothetical protein
MRRAVQIVGLLVAVSVAAGGVAACAEQPVVPSTPQVAVVAPAAPPPPAQDAAPDVPPPPSDDCPDGTLAACAASCAARVERACDELGKRTCTEGSVLECNAACDGGNDAACRALGAMYESGTRVARSEDSALELYDRECKKGRRWACSDAGDVLVRREQAHWDDLGPTHGASDSPGDPEMLARTLSYYDAGCDKDDPGAGDWRHWVWGRSWGNACAQLLYASPDRILPALEARCTEGPRPGEHENWLDRADPCTLVADSGASTTMAKSAAMQRICARNAQSEYCGRLKDIGTSR